jgi:hypothetical protein
VVSPFSVVVRVTEFTINGCAGKIVVSPFRAVVRATEFTINGCTGKHVATKAACNSLRFIRRNNYSQKQLFAETIIRRNNLNPKHPRVQNHIHKRATVHG